MIKGAKGGIRFFLLHLGLGFLLGLTGSVIAAPRYAPELDRSASLVYNAGLTPEGQGGEATGKEEDKGQGTTKKEGEIFVSRGCIQCHEVSAYGLKGGVTGPDLSLAYNDVPDRFGKSLQEFLLQPEGTMGEIIPGKGLTEAEKQEILDLLIRAANPPRSGGETKEGKQEAEDARDNSAVTPAGE